MKVLTTPCNECPWRRKHPAGWLGGYTPESFVQQVQWDGPPIPCHKTIPEGGEARAMCAGALIFMKNSCKSAQHPGYGNALEQVEKDTENVFQWPHEFLHYHSPEGQKEWLERIRTKPCLFNGGPMDGQLMSVDFGQREVRFAERSPAPVTFVKNPPPTSKISDHRYVRNTNDPTQFDYVGKS